MLGFIRDLVREYRFGPRVKDSLKLVAGPAGQAEEAIINSDAMSNDRVVLWDGTFGTTGRLKTTGVSAGELAYLDGVIAGTAKASRAVVLSSNKSVSGINSLSAVDITLSEQIEAPDIIAKTHLVSLGTLSIAGTSYLNGKVGSNLKIENTKKLQLYYGSTPRDMIRRSSATSITVYIGNSADRLYFDTAAYDLYHRRAGSNYKIWTQHNDGSGSGLDADKLDGQHGSYYRNASNINAGTLPYARLPIKTGSYHAGDVPGGIGGSWNIYHGLGTSQFIAIVSMYTPSNKPGDNDIVALRVTAKNSSYFTVKTHETAGEVQDLYINWVAIRTY